MSGGVFTHTFHACLLEAFAVGVVELVAVSVTLADVLCAVCLGGERTVAQGAVVGAEAHCAAEIGDVFLLFHKVNHVVGRGVVHLCAVGVGEAEDVAGKLYHHALHAEAYTESGHIVLAAPSESHKLALDTALAEAGGDNHAVETGKALVYVGFGEFLGVYIVELKLVACVCGGVEKSLAD